MIAKTMTKKAVSKQKILVAALIATVAAGGYFYYRQQQAAALPAFVAQSNGRLELNRIDVATLYPGRVKKVYVEEGADVKSGDILAELSSDTSSSRVEEARAAADRQRESVQRAKAAEEQTRRTVARAEANIEAARQQQRVAKMEWDNARNLLSEQLVSESETARRRADYERATAAVKAAEAARAEAARQQSAAQAAQARVAALEAKLREIEAQQTERGLLVTLGDVLFEFGKADLLAAAGPRLDKLAEFLRQYPDRRLLVEGYTDSVGSASYNLDLSRRRAQAVQTALTQRGIDISRITAQGYGKDYPVANNATAEGRAMNRRVEVIIADDKGNLRGRNQ